MNKITFYLDEVENVLNKNHQSPICAEVDPSNYCNNRCSFCCFSDFINANQEHLSMELYTKFLKEFVSLGGKAITFTGGGEPLMSPYFIKMAQMAKNRKLSIGLVTNGTLLNRIEGFESLFRFIRISLNAATPEVYQEIHGTDFFHKVIRNIATILKLKDRPHVGISFVTCEKNKHQINDIVTIGENLGVEYVHIKPDIHNENLELDGASEGIKITSSLKLSSRFGKLPCAIAGLVFILNATGDVYYCCVQRGNPDFRLGKINNFCVSDFVRIREKFTPDISQCTTCRYTTYAEHYEKYKGNGYIFLRHKEFL